MGRVVLVAGVGSDIGGRLARRIRLHPHVDSVLGLDGTTRSLDFGDVALLSPDTGTSSLVDVLAAEQVDTVVLPGVAAGPAGDGRRAPVNGADVIATMRLLAACSAAPALERLVVTSSSDVYGASPLDPSLFTEEMTARRPPRAGFARSCIAVEDRVREVARHRPDVAVTLLRCASLIGPTIETSLTRYLSLPVVPTVLGFDARLQFLHEDDALAVLAQAALTGVAGTFNIAGDGVLMLSQALRRAGRRRLPLPRSALRFAGTSLPQLSGVAMSPDRVSFLTYGRGMDTARMRSELGFTPRYTTADAFAAFVDRRAPGA